MSVECKNCGKNSVEHIDDDRFVCEECGSAFDLHYVGCHPYDDGGEQFFDEQVEVVLCDNCQKDRADEI
jgi:protein-arginine kinase activator protein McsA